MSSAFPAMPVGAGPAGRRALVTGGAGFIGSHLADALLERGDEVVVLDDLSVGRRENVDPRATLIAGSVTDADAVARASEGTDVIFHLAAQIDVRRSVADPRHDLEVNVAGTLAVAAASRRVVFASTGGAIYGGADVVPTPETARERPEAPYGQAKLAAEGYLRVLGGLTGVPATCLRFANVYGPRQDPLGEGGVCAIFCGAAVAGDGVVIYGDGEQTRDFVYVGDVVEALLAGAQDGAPFGPFNVGTGRETTVNALAAHLGLDVRRVEARAGEARRSCLDPARAADALGWRPRTGLAAGLERTLAWARAQAA